MSRTEKVMITARDLRNRANAGELVTITGDDLGGIADNLEDTERFLREAEKLNDRLGIAIRIATALLGVILCIALLTIFDVIL